MNGKRFFKFMAISPGYASYLLSGFCRSLRLSKLLQFRLQRLMRVQVLLLDFRQQNLFALECSHCGGRRLEGQICEVVLRDVRGLLSSQVLVGDGAVGLIGGALGDAS